MIKNKNIKNCIIGACIVANTFAGTAAMAVYADTNAADLPEAPDMAAVSQMAPEQVDKAAVLLMAQDTPVSSDDGRVYKTQLMQANANDAVEQKHQEIDKYLFEEHKDELAQKGFEVTHTVAVGDKVEIGIKPYSADKADYLYGIFGKDVIEVVQGDNPEIMQVSMVDTAAPQAEAPAKSASFFASIWEWIRNIF